MKKIGIVIAVEIEAFYKKYGEPDEIISVHNQEVRKFSAEGYELYTIRSGAGEIAAASATQLLISAFNVEMILNFGVVGGLTDEISKHRICIVKEVVHYDFDTSPVDNCEVGRYLEYPSVYIPTNEDLRNKAMAIAPELVPVICASGDKFIADPEAKRNIHTNFNADICEMESAGIVLTCDRNGVPCLLIKMVADGIEGGAEEYTKEFTNSSEKCLDVLERVIAEL